jgi:hypothetical protein
VQLCHAFRSKRTFCHTFCGRVDDTRHTLTHSLDTFGGILDEAFSDIHFE